MKKIVSVVLLLLMLFSAYSTTIIAAPAGHVDSNESNEVVNNSCQTLYRYREKKYSGSPLWSASSDRILYKTEPYSEYYYRVTGFRSERYYITGAMRITESKIEWYKEYYSPYANLVFEIEFLMTGYLYNTNSDGSGKDYNFYEKLSPYMDSSGKVYYNMSKYGDTILYYLGTGRLYSLDIYSEYYYHYYYWSSWSTWSETPVTASDDVEVEKKTVHSYASVVTTPTCTEQGYTTHTCSCGNSYKDSYTDALGHTEKILEAVEPTCTNVGYTEGKYCSVCNDILIEQEKIDALPHSYGSWVNANIETHKRTCECGAFETQNHSWDNGIITTEATHTELGNRKYTCSVCSAVKNEDIPKTPEHSFSEWTTEVSPTCTSEGKDVRSCRCGEKEIRVTSPLGHNKLSYESKTPTCVEIGWNAYEICTRCDYTTYIELPALGHTYISSVTYPTCIEEGYTTYTCSCGENYISDYTPALGHTEIIIEAVPPTCTEAGSTEGKYCDICKTILITSEYIAPTGHDWGNWIENPPTCTVNGENVRICNVCTKTEIETVSATGHTWSDWIITVDPTYTTDGEQIRYCTVCKFTEGEKIPTLEPPYDPNKPIITVDNYIVTITNADNIKDMRYVLGKYSTTTEVRNAEGNVALDNGVVTANTIDDNFVYEMPTGGYYTIWIRMKDGTNYILPLDVTKITASVSTYGVKITLHDLFDVKDFYIAKGEYQTYREIKDNGYIVSVTSAKIGNKHDYTYTVYEPGVHTILVRYNDGRSVIFHEDLTVTEPTFTTNGLQVTIGNIPDVKVIRTAYGEYYTPGDTKRAPGARNFSNKSVIKNADEYMIQYRDEGIVTIIVEYNNGYVKVFHYNVEMKRADYIQAMSSVIFDNLDGFVMIRYAMGEYTTAAQIKRASDSKVIKPADITGERAIISGLAKGTYTFCVQYDDDSYNYFVITVTG